MTQLLTEEQRTNFPVEHLSPSSIRKYLENPHGFFKNYVRLEYDDTLSPALLEGDAMHRVLAEYYDGLTKAPQHRKQFDHAAAAERILLEVFNPEAIAKTKFGKTGSLEKSFATVRAAIGFYFAELPEIETVVSVEERFLTDFEDLENEPMPIPLKGFTDLVTLQVDDYVIRDHKFVASFSIDGDGVIDVQKFAAYEMQAAPYFFLTRKRYGKSPTRMVFDEVKKSKNRDGGQQRQEVVVEFEPKMLNRWLEIYRRVVKSLAGIPLIDPETGVVQFLPNPFAQFAEDSWADFCEEVDSGRVWTLDKIREIRSSKFARPEEVEALF